MKYFAVRIATLVLFIFVWSVRANGQNNQNLKIVTMDKKHIDKHIEIKPSSSMVKPDELNWFQKILTPTCDKPEAKHHKPNRTLNKIEKPSGKSQTRLVLLLQDIPDLNVDYNQMTIAVDKHTPCYFNAISCYGRHNWSPTNQVYVEKIRKKLDPAGREHELATSLLNISNLFKNITGKPPVTYTSKFPSILLAHIFFVTTLMATSKLFQLNLINYTNRWLFVPSIVRYLSLIRFEASQDQECC